jgi:Mycothiol maleylpyruvate isomerase N-terminal domain
MALVPDTKDWTWVLRRPCPERLRLMLTVDDPRYPDWDQDATAVADRYGEQDPADVAVALAGAADQLASRFASVSDEQWSRTGTRSDGARFTVESFARYLIHDPIHHLYDVTGHRHGDAVGVPPR